MIWKQINDGNSITQLCYLSIDSRFYWWLINSHRRLQIKTPSKCRKNQKHPFQESVIIFQDICLNLLMEKVLNTAHLDDLFTQDVNNKLRGKIFRTCSSSFGERRSRKRALVTQPCYLSIASGLYDYHQLSFINKTSTSLQTAPNNPFMAAEESDTCPLYIAKVPSSITAIDQTLLILHLLPFSAFMLFFMKVNVLNILSFRVWVSDFKSCQVQRHYHSVTYIVCIPTSPFFLFSIQPYCYSYTV